MKFISAVTSIGSLQYHSNYNQPPPHMMVSSGHTSGPVPSRLPPKRDSRIPGPGIQKQVLQQPCQSQSNVRKTVRTPSVGPVPSSSTSNCSNSHQSKSSMSDVSSRRSSSPASNSSSLSLSKNNVSSSLIPGAPEIVINRRINTGDNRQNNCSRPSIRPPRPTSIPSAPNHPSVATNGSIPPGHFSPAKLSQPVITPRVDSSQRLVRNIGMGSNSYSSTNNVNVLKGRGQELNGMRKRENPTTGRRGNNHQSSLRHQSNPSPPSIQSEVSSSSSPSSLQSSSPSTAFSSPPHSVNDRINTDHMSNKENSSFNSSGSSDGCNMKESKSSNHTMGNGTSLSATNSGGSSLPSSPAKFVPSSSLLSRTTSPGHFISHNYHNRTNDDFHLSVYSDSECSRKSKVNILYSYSPSARSNFPAISEIAGVIETSTSLSNNNCNLIENNSLLAKCCNKATSQLESTPTRRDQLVSNVNPNLDRDGVMLNNSLRSSPIKELEAQLQSNGFGKCPSLRNLSNGQHQSATNGGSILIGMPSGPFIASHQFRRLSKNSDLRGSAASLLSSSSNFSSVSTK